MMRNALTDFILEFGEKPYGTVDNKLACHRTFLLFVNSYLFNVFFNISGMIGSSGGVGA